ncbi:hypothetical protein [Streptomyces naphthomycinicus]|uniref:hypothetical protein n=1 Tax=Streptomyces naphthomycinicus TaxID=2872625 RepID=UPI001CED7E29|nr:hypothetical protein [Streptomyces sp. TML10]
MDSGDWIALIAVVVSVGAAFISAWQARIARTSADSQMEMAKRVHREQNEPYVVVDIEPYQPGSPAMVLVIENIGPTVARNVRISCDPPIVSNWGDDLTATLQQIMSQPISALPPRRRLVYLFDDHDRWRTDLPTAYTFTVQCDGPEGAVEALEYMIDFGFWGDSLIGERPTKRLEEELDSISTVLGKLTDSVKLAAAPMIREERRRQADAFRERRNRVPRPPSPDLPSGSPDA